LQQVTIHVRDALRQLLVEFREQRERHRVGDEVGILDGWSVFCINRIRTGGARLDADHAGRRTLKHGDVGADVAQILRDIVRAASRADDENTRARGRDASLVILRVNQLALERFGTGDRGPVGHAEDSGGLHDVARMELGDRAVGTGEPHGPASLVVVVGGVDELRLEPDVETEHLRVGLEPIRHLVLGQVGRPRSGKGKIRKMIRPDLVVQQQRLVAIAPVVAHAPFAVDDHGVEIELLQPGGNRETRLPGADDEYLRIPRGRRAARVRGQERHDRGCCGCGALPRALRSP
jgi:hypothetical protein